jgi:proteasome lid subunit RPN8/RPN11
MYEHLAHQLQRFSPDDPYERCGFLLSRRFGTPLSLREVPNSHPEPATNFRITDDLYKEAVRTFSMSKRPGRPRSVVGVFHTHPHRGLWEDVFPSASDLAGAAKWPYFVHLVYHPFTRRLTQYAGEGIIKSFHLKPRWIYRKVNS